MKSSESRMIRYHILDPSGNITALVENRVDIARQPHVAAEIMRSHPEVEQVGFVSFPDVNTGNEILPELRMAGGEFCGNASMCAAVLYYLNLKKQECGKRSGMISIKVSGISDPVKVSIEDDGSGKYKTGVCMPAALDICRRFFEAGDISGELPVVRMEGISHIVIDEESCFYCLINEPEKACLAVKHWCGNLSAEGLGLMFLEKIEDKMALTPLVYIPGSETVFWENSCASGTAATGIFLADKTGEICDLEIREPGGCLHVVSNPSIKETWLYGNVRNKDTYELI